MTTKTPKLSPTMQAAIWNAAGVRIDLMPTEMRRIARKGVRTGTGDALALRGLTETGLIWNLTDAGRAWCIAEIETAYVEALWANLDRAQRISVDPTGSALTDRAERMLLRAGEQVGIMIPADFAEPDRIEALHEHVRRAQREASEQHTKPHASRMTLAMVDAAELEALALAARWDVADCPVEIIERDGIEAWGIWNAARDVRALRAKGDNAGAIRIASLIGYSLDVLRQIAPAIERVEVGADGCGCLITEQITASGASVEGTERTEHRAGCWNTPAAELDPVYAS